MPEVAGTLRRTPTQVLQTRVNRMRDGTRAAAVAGGCRRHAPPPRQVGKCRGVPQRFNTSSNAAFARVFSTAVPMVMRIQLA